MADSEFAGDVFGGLGYGGRVVVLESGVDHADGAPSFERSKRLPIELVQPIKATLENYIL